MGSSALPTRYLPNRLDDDIRRRRMGAMARVRAVADFSYDVLADRLRIALDDVGA